MDMDAFYQNKGLCWQELTTTSDINGNSRRLFIVYGRNGDFLYVSPTHYETPKKLLPQLPGYRITPGDYQETIRIAKKLGVWRD